MALANYDVNFGREMNLTVVMDDEEVAAWASEAVHDGLIPRDCPERRRLKAAFQVWAESDLENDELYTGSGATVRFFPGTVTSASLIDYVDGG